MATRSRHARAALFAVVVCALSASLAADIAFRTPSQVAELKFRATKSAKPSAKPSVTTSQAAPPASDARVMLDTYCVACHNQRLKTAGLALDTIDVTAPHANPEVWERVITRLRAGSMPPAGRPRPDAATYESVAASLESGIDRAWIANPNPGRVNAVHRLNRTQYSNAVRDLFALDAAAFDVKSL